jgi:hypothetical protein
VAPERVVTLEEKYKDLIEDFRRRMREKGYPEGIINRAIDQALWRTYGTAFKYFDHAHPERAEQIMQETFPKFLADAERYVENLMKAIAG